MSKFKAGDKVMFKAYENSISNFENHCPYIDLHQPQTVSQAPDGKCDIFIEKDDWWDADYWELVEEWAKHQRKVDSTTELELTKLQIKMLQDSRNAGIRLLSKAASALEACHNYELAEEINKFLGEE